MNSYIEYKELRDKQNIIVDALSDKLNSFPRGQFGLIPDHVTSTDEFKSIKKQYRIEFKKLQNINQQGVRLFKKEINKEYEDSRKNRRVN